MLTHFHAILFIIFATIFTNLHISFFLDSINSKRFNTFRLKHLIVSFSLGILIMNDLILYVFSMILIINGNFDLLISLIKYFFPLFLILVMNNLIILFNIFDS